MVIGPLITGGAGGGGDSCDTLPWREKVAGSCQLEKNGYLSVQPGSQDDVPSCPTGAGHMPKVIGNHWESRSPVWVSLGLPPQSLAHKEKSCGAGTVCEAGWREVWWLHHWLLCVTDPLWASAFSSLHRDLADLESSTGCESQWRLSLDSRILCSSPETAKS